MTRTKPARERGDILRQGLVALRLLTERPRLRSEIAAELQVSARTVSRILRAMAAAGLPIRGKREGREVYYSVAP